MGKAQGLEHATVGSGQDIFFFYVNYLVLGLSPSIVGATNPVASDLKASPER